MRALIADLGDAYCEELERTAVGDFRLEDADPDRTIPLEQALAFLPERALGDDEAEDVRHGRPLEGAAEHEAVRLTHGDKLVAVGVPDSGRVRTAVVFDPA